MKKFFLSIFILTSSLCCDEKYTALVYDENVINKLLDYGPFTELEFVLQEINKISKWKQKEFSCFITGFNETLLKREKGYIETGKTLKFQKCSIKHKEQKDAAEAIKNTVNELKELLGPAKPIQRESVGSEKSTEEKESEPAKSTEESVDLKFFIHLEKEAKDIDYIETAYTAMVKSRGEQREYLETPDREKRSFLMDKAGATWRSWLVPVRLRNWWKAIATGAFLGGLGLFLFKKRGSFDFPSMKKRFSP